MARVTESQRVSRKFVQVFLARAATGITVGGQGMKPEKPNRPPDIQWDIDWAEKAENLKIAFVPTIQRHQFCAFHGLGDVAFHRKERIKILWPQYEWHRWSDRRLEGLSKYHWNVWFGPSASGKTSDAAITGVEYWLEAPDRTAVIACSTTMKMLRMRIWGQIARWHQGLPKGIGHVGELLDSVTRIRWKQGSQNRESRLPRA